VIKNGQSLLSIIAFSVLVLCVQGCTAPPSSRWEQDKQRFLQASRNEWNHHIKTWQEVACWSFDDNVMPEVFHVYSGQWRVADGKLCSVGGEPDRNRKVKITNCLWAAFRPEFDVVLQAGKNAPRDRIGDVGISLNADSKTGSFAKGYAFILAQYFDQATVFYRLNVPYARTEFSPIEPGRQHHVMVEVVKPHLRLWVDGRIVLEGWERIGRNNRDYCDFMDMDPNRAIVLHTYDTVMEIDNLRILTPVVK